jgi:energy-converting hydrogenase Eha subunit H
MKPKYKLTKAQLRKRKNRRLVVKPQRMKIKNALRRICRFYAAEGEKHVC